MGSPTVHRCDIPLSCTRLIHSVDARILEGVDLRWYDLVAKEKQARRTPNSKLHREIAEARSKHAPDIITARLRARPDFSLDGIFQSRREARSFLRDPSIKKSLAPPFPQATKMPKKEELLSDYKLVASRLKENGSDDDDEDSDTGLPTYLQVY